MKKGKKVTQKILGMVLLYLSMTNLNVLAQQESQYTQYMYNTININPAYAGSQYFFRANAMYRAQWIGVEGAPTTQTITFSGPIGDNWGLGAAIYNDKIGPSQEFFFAADLAYKLQVSNTVNLSVGLKAGVHNFSVNYDKLNIERENDAPFNRNLSEFAPVFGAGLYMYSQNWYVGFSSPNLVATKYYRENTNAGERSHLYMIAGVVVDINDELKFKPATMVKTVSGAPLAVDVSANFLFKEKFTVGIGYRWDAAVSALLGFQVSKRLMIGYAYDYDTTEFSNYNSGSHEFLLNYSFLKPITAIKSPRFF